MDRWILTPALVACALALAGCMGPDESAEDGLNDPDAVGDPQDDGLDTNASDVNATNDPDALGDPEDDGLDANVTDDEPADAGDPGAGGTYG